MKYQDKMNLIQYQCVRSKRKTDLFPLTEKKRKSATMAGSSRVPRAVAKNLKDLSISSKG